MICVFNCPSCGDKMHFSIEKQALECPTCGSICEMDNYDMDYLTYDGSVEYGDDVKQLTCPQCSARITVSEGNAKQYCGYCGAELAAFGLGDDILAPEKIIPFKLTEDNAKGKLISWWQKHPTMPKLDFNKLQMTFEDMYVPVWLVSSEAVADVKAVTEIKHEERDDRRRQNNTYTVKYNVRKMVQSSYSYIPFDSSCHIRNEQFHDIEPFDYSMMLDFNAAYLSGHMAEVYHENASQTIPRVIGRVREFALEDCKQSVETDARGGGEIVSILHQECDVTPSEIIYLIAPVWVCKYVYKGKTNYIYINGETGKVAGDVLFSNKRFELEVGAYGITSLILGAGIGGLLSIIFYGESKEITYLPMIAFVILGAKFGEYMFSKRKRTNMEEVQLRQGKKMSVVTDCMVNIVLGIVTCLLNLFVSVPFALDSNDFDVFLIVTIAGCIIYTVVAVLAYVDKLGHYYTYIKKARFSDYIKYTNYKELISEANRI